MFSIFHALFILFDDEKHNFMINGNLVPGKREKNGIEDGGGGERNGEKYPLILIESIKISPTLYSQTRTQMRGD